MRQGFLFGRWMAARTIGVAGSSAALVVAASLFMATASTGCENNRTSLTKEQEQQGLGLPDSHSPTRTIRLGQRCTLDELIVEPKEGSPEAVIYALLESAKADGDDGANFSSFYSHFDPSKDRKFVRKQYWSKARKYVSKYIQGDSADGVSFKVCRREEQRGGDKIKFYIQSLDTDKSNPPITLKKGEAGEWKVVAYTP